MRNEPSRRDAAVATNRTDENGPAAVADSGARDQARRGLALYGAVVVALSAPLQAVIIRADLDGGANGAAPWLVLITGLMFVPALASAVARLVLREGFADVAFHAGGRRGRGAILAALAFPVAVGSVAYGAGWATGLVQFVPPPPGAWAALLAVYAALNLALVSGEEIGWRGYMLTRLIDAGVPAPLLASGLLWGLWHVPLVLWGGYADGPSPALSVALLLVATTAFGHLLARLRLETGSVWPAVALHAGWNVAIQAGFDPATTGAHEALWLGEHGLLTALTLALAAALASRRRWTIPRHPRGARPVAGAAQLAAMRHQPVASGPSPSGARRTGPVGSGGAASAGAVPGGVTDRGIPQGPQSSPAGPILGAATGRNTGLNGDGHGKRRATPPLTRSWPDAASPAVVRRA